MSGAVVFFLVLVGFVYTAGVAVNLIIGVLDYTHPLTPEEKSEAAARVVGAPLWPVRAFGLLAQIAAHAAAADEPADRCPMCGQVRR